MKLRHAEAIYSPVDGPNARRYLKRRAARAARHNARRYLDDAPSRVVRGWWS